MERERSLDGGGERAVRWTVRGETRGRALQVGARKRERRGEESGQDRTRQDAKCQSGSTYSWSGFSCTLDMIARAWVDRERVN